MAMYYELKLNHGICPENLVIIKATSILDAMNKYQNNQGEFTSEKRGEIVSCRRIFYVYDNLESKK